MPEGDTIRRLADAIDARFVGHRVERDVFRHPRLATTTFAGTTLTSTSSHGKHLFLRFDDGRSVHVHLLMQGRVQVGGRAGGTRRSARDARDRHDEKWRRRFELWFDVGPLVGVDIPLLHVVATSDEGSFVDHLGPDLCGDDFDIVRDVTVGVERMLASPAEPLGGALLEQRNLAGFGNIYAVETPFVCGISPFRPVGEIDGLQSLVRIGAALIRTNAVRGPQNTTGRRLAESETWILDGGRRDCRVCSTRLERFAADQVAWQRRTVRCPECQADGNGRADLDRSDRLLRLHPAHRTIEWP